MLDGIDLDNHVVASYYLRDRLEGQKFLDHLSLVQALGLEGSTGTWEKVEEDTEAVRQAMSSKMVGYHEIPSEDPYVKSAVVQLAFPIRAWGDNIPMMLLAIAGNCFAYSKHIMLTDLFIGKELLKKFQGPKFGVDGIRKLTGVQERPLSLHIIKPKMGMTPEQTANQVRQTALGGADMCKDDEMLADAYNNTMEQRLPLVMDAINRAADKTGKRMVYMCSITDEPKKMIDKARRAIDLGANGLLVTYSAGLGALRELTSHPDINVPVMLHASHMIAMMKQIAWPVLAKLCRLCGADMMLTPTMWSSIPMVSMEEGLRTSFVKLAPVGTHQAHVPHAVRRRVSGPGRGDYRRVRAGHRHSGRRRHVGTSRRLHGRRPVVATGHCRGDGRRASARGGPEAGERGPASCLGEVGLHGAAQDALAPRPDYQPRR